MEAPYPRMDADYVLAATAHTRHMPTGPECLQLVRAAVEEASDVVAALSAAQRALAWLPSARRHGFLRGCSVTDVAEAAEDWLATETALEREDASLPETAFQSGTARRAP